MFASIIGELVSLVYLLTSFKLKKHFKFRKGFFKNVKSGKGTFTELMGIALPSTGSRMIGSISWFFEPIVVAQSLQLAGVTAAALTSQYGELTGYALPLLMLPSFVTASLATALVPAVSEARTTGNFSLVEHRLQQALKITFITGCLAVVTLFIFAEPILQVMYGSSHAAVFIKFLSPFFILYYFQYPLQSMLQALDLAKAAMFNSLAGNILKIGVIWPLASKESFGIMGAAIGIAVGSMLVTFLHFSTVLKVVPFTLHFRSYMLALVIALISGWGGYYIYQDPLSSQPLGTRLLLSVTVVFLLFTFFMLLTGFIKKADLIRIPVIGVFLSRFAWK